MMLRAPHTNEVVPCGTNEKSESRNFRIFVMCVSDIDAKPLVANLDAHRFCRGYNNPLTMIDVALDRYLPGCNAMLANEVYADR